jgi:isoleucyl-tRNA synthetase
VLHRLAELDRIVRDAYGRQEFRGLLTTLHNFCAVDLSAFYFDIRKDSLYCDRPDAPKRRAVRTVMDKLFDCMTAWLAPILCFTAEEAWLARHGDNGEGSVHLTLFPEVPAAWLDPALGARWDRIRELRRVVTGALELARADKKIGASLQAHPALHVARAEDRALMASVDMAEIAITSGLTLANGEAPAGAFTLTEVPGVAAVVGLASGEKCARCWKVLDEVGTIAAHPELCHRCADAVEHLQT